MDTDEWNARADAVWMHLEAYHATVYFAPEHRRACDEAGLRGGWMAYFASRACPLGAATPQLVTALFYNFHPAMVARALPDAWSLALPDTVCAVRYDSVGRALDRLLGPARDDRDLERAAALARRVVVEADAAGHPMFAANASLAWPESPSLVLWHAATLAREHRGDGHVATLVAEGIDGCQAHVLQVAGGVMAAEDIRPFRGWSDSDWTDAVDGLVDRGLMTPQLALTDAGVRLRRHIADRTAALAAVPLIRAGAAVIDELLSTLATPVQAIIRGGGIPYPNPMGVPLPPGLVPTIG